MICSKSSSQQVKAWVAIQLCKFSRLSPWYGVDLHHIGTRGTSLVDFSEGKVSSGCSPPLSTVSAPGIPGQPLFSLACALQYSQPVSEMRTRVSWSPRDILRDCVHCWRQPSVRKCWHVCTDSSTGKKPSGAAVGWWVQKATDVPEGQMDVSLGTENHQKNSHASHPVVTRELSAKEHSVSRFLHPSPKQCIGNTSSSWGSSWQHLQTYLSLLE